MGTILARELVTRCESELFDDGHAHWPEKELLRFLSDGQRQVVLLVPEAYPTNGIVGLAAGTRQQIPDNAYTFLTAVCNVTAYAAGPPEQITRGRAVRAVERTVLDHNHPDWHSEAPNPIALHFVFDPRDRRHFYIWPPHPSADGDRKWMEIIYADVPAEVVAEDDEISLNDNYATLLFYYMMFRAHSKDQPEAMEGKAAGYNRLFMEGLGLRVEQPQRTNPGQSEELRRQIPGRSVS